MMIYKKIAILVIAATIGGNIFAQKRSNNFQDKNPEEASKQMTERMTEKLVLTDDQAVSVEQILLKSMTTRKEISDKYPQLKEAKAEVKAIKKESKTAVKAVLTDEQKALLKNSKGKKDNAQKPKKGAPRNDVNSKINKLNEKVNLTQDQEKQIRSILENTEQKRLAVEKKYPELKAAKAEKKANKAKTDTELKKVLTAEQYEKYQKHPKKGKPGKGKKGKNGKGHQKKQMN